MNDKSRKQADDESAGPVAGEKLADARRLKQISLPDIARELHLDEPKVQALEENRFEMLGAPVFAKGHLRKYAEIVGVSIDDVMADYYTLTRATPAPPVVGKPRETVRELNLGPWLVVLPLLLLIGGLLWWWLGRLPADNAAPVDAEPATAEPRPAEAAAPPPREAGRIDIAPAAAAAELAATPNAGPTGDNAPAEPLADPAAVADNAAPATPATVQLALTFSGDCWTEVTAGDGERLFFDLGRAGRRVVVDGVAPIRVLLGDSNNVSLEVNGEPRTIGTGERRGATARLTIDP